MEEKLTRQEILNLISAIEGKERVQSFDVSFAMAKTLRKLLGIRKDIGKAQQDNIKYSLYQEKKIELAKKYSYKNKDGNPESVPGKGGFAIKDVNTFNEKLIVLDKEYEKVLDEYDKFMNEQTIKVDIHKVDKEKFPDDFDVRGVSIFVKE